MVVDMAGGVGRPQNQNKQRPCAYCTRTFTKAEHLSRHQRSHTGERPFKCTRCGKRYARSDVLARHLQKHAVEGDDREGTSDASAPNSRDRFPSPPGREPNRTTNQTLRNPEDDIVMFVGTSVGTGPHGHHISPGQSHGRSADWGASGSAHFNYAISNQDFTTQPTPAISTAFSKPQPRECHLSSRGSVISATNIAAEYLYSDKRTPSDSNCIDNQDARNSYQLHPAIPEDPSRIGGTVPDSTSDVSRISTGKSPGRQLIQSQPSQPIGVDFQLPLTEEQTVPQDISNPSPSSYFSELTKPHSNDRIDDSPRNSEASHGRSLSLGFGPDFNAYDFNFETTPRAPNPQSSPNLMNLLNMSPSMMALSPPYLDFEANQESRPKTPFSMKQIKRIQKLWPRQRTTCGVRLIRTLWQDTVQHGADNLFSEPHDSDTCSPHDHARTSRWNMNEECRERLIRDCIQGPSNQNTADADSLPAFSPPGTGSQETALEALNTEFPSLETLDTSLDFFFRYSYPAMPFIHKATFDAHRTPSSLLWPMCLIGLSIINPQGLNDFIRQHLVKMIHSCRVDLTSKALGRCRPSELVCSLASTLTVAYLALGYVKDLDECQVLLVCAQMLRLAEKHGLFAAYDSTNFILDVLESHLDSEGLWKSWARVESVKRTILCLIWIDSAYTRLLGTGGVIEIEKVEVILPCDSVLFEAQTAASFTLATDIGTVIVMPRMHMQHSLGPPPGELYDLSIRTLLCALHLQISTFSHRLLVGRNPVFEAYLFVPAQAFAADASAKHISSILVFIAAKHYNTIQGKTAVTALTWNNLCMMLTADLNRFELASGRGDRENTRTALADVAVWSRSISARRAVLHAAQTYRILSLSRISENNLMLPELLLFSSALVIGLYLYLAPRIEEDESSLPLEVLQEIDWSAVGGDGLFDTSDASKGYQCSHTSLRHMRSCCAARHYIAHGGLISFDGEIQRKGKLATQKMLVCFAHLIDEVSNRQVSEYSQLLRALSDLIITDDQQDVDQVSTLGPT